MSKSLLYSWLILLPMLVLTACSPYQKLLNSSDLELKYKKAKEYYEKEDYFRALPLFEELISVYKGTKNVEDIYFYYSNSHFGMGEYLLAAYHFKNLVKTYPKSQYAEEALFMHAYCYYMLSPVHSLDQTETKKAINAFQLFINTYPQSAKVAETNQLIDELRDKLETKAFSSAHLYLKQGLYKSAATAFGNLLKDFPDTQDREEAVFYILKSNYLLAENSIRSKKEERYHRTIDSYYRFIDNYGNSKMAKEAEQIYESSVKQLKKIEHNE